MSKQIRRQAEELLHTQLNVKNENEYKETYSNKELIKREVLDRTPFTIITVLAPDSQGQDEEHSFGTLGKYRITENRKTKQEIEEELRSFSWDMVLKILSIIIPNEIERILTEISKQNNGNTNIETGFDNNTTTDNHK